MSEEPTEQIFCHWELASFPRDQFKEHADYGLVHERPPGEETPKHTVSGQPLPDEKAAVTKWAVPSQAFRSD